MAFTPVLAGSTAYPELRLRWAPTSQPTDASQTFVDITDRLRGWSWGYGRNDELARFEAGTGHVLLDNRDRALDPSYNAGPWFGNIKPRRMFELVARWAGVEYPVFKAYARSFPLSWPGTVDGIVKVDLVDAFAVLQRVDLVVGFMRDAELSGARVSALLDAVGIPAGLRDIDTGTVTVGMMSIESAGTSALDHAKHSAVDCERGQFFVAKDGKVTFHDYDRRLNAASLWTFTDAPGAPLAYAPDFEVGYDETYLWNYARVTGMDGEDTAHTAEDVASQDDYHKLTRTHSTELVNGSEIQQVADRIVFLYAQPAQRVPAMSVSGAGNPAARWPVLLDLEVSDRITVRRFAGSSDPMDLVQNVEGIRHSCQRGGPWETTIITSPADTTTYLTADHASLGLVDSVNRAA